MPLHGIAATFTVATRAPLYPETSCWSQASSRHATASRQKKQNHLPASLGEGVSLVSAGAGLLGHFREPGSGVWDACL
jgi:hypothetical protein